MTHNAENEASRRHVSGCILDPAHGAGCVRQQWAASDPDAPWNRAEKDVPLATRLADPGDYVREQLIEGDFGDPWDMPLWQREHLARVIEHLAPRPIPSGASDTEREATR